MAARPYRALRVFLFVVAALEGLGGVLLLFATGWILTIGQIGPGIYAGAESVLFVKAIGIIALALGYLLCAAARDPVRYIAVIDALAFILVAAAAINIYALIALHAGDLYPGPYLVVRAVMQLLLAIVVIALRPRRELYAQAR
jgi:hypothetical protein